MLSTAHISGLQDFELRNRMRAHADEMRSARSMLSIKHGVARIHSLAKTSELDHAVEKPLHIAPQRTLLWRAGPHLAACFKPRKTPRKLTALVLSKSSALTSKNGCVCLCRQMPALLTNVLSAPKCSTASSTAFATLSSDLIRNTPTQKLVMQLTVTSLDAGQSQSQQAVLPHSEQDLYVSAELESPLSELAVERGPTCRACMLL